ncbi:6-phosphogluconate dehydrogenase (decarboxylating) [Marinitoga hydrogenitolerans DSM 16785]|uniref:6-phosphogluconate dehydrogenase (Decarboxylating) n=1 Tax=Marinitoga hydrogenitolerans (strain DSM 16785 / JCM 12826 / AT1271) TaxID=1122195 RepID=A0A1M4S5G9_MARH1|nr:decarboxylating 6-phosphogluconate dehydrogenase [Marinitoga hydrogenitolerans]SHE27257.1 6-phosphogluconate dehydrogenase (decarboxylating) [Marinitoga hydrogenitolerans DSM 16785]
MKLGIIGLGRMGKNMAKRLLKGGHSVVVYNRTKEKVKELEKDGAIGTYSLKEFVKNLDTPKIVWLMLPAGKITDDNIDALIPLLEKGDIIIDGANTYYKDDLRRTEKLKNHGIHYLDAGVSGGVWGLKEGYCTMVGGEKKIFEYIVPILKTLAPKDGYLYCGPNGAGHFVKMIHNGIEYGLMEAYGEGFELLKASQYGKYINLHDIAHLWNQGSVIRSWLLELLENAFKNDDDLENIQGYVEDSGEARWTVLEAVEKGVSIPIISNSLFKRFQSRQKDVFSDKVVAALRKEFGGHAVYKKEQDVKENIAGAGEVKPANPDETYRR